MTDREDFSFDEETSPDAAESGIYRGNPEAASEDAMTSDDAPKGSTTRILLLVLLLVAVGAAGFHFLLGAEDTEPVPPVQLAVKKQPIAVPPRPAQVPTPAAQEPMPAAEEAPPQVPEPDPAKTAEEKTLAEKNMEVAPAGSGEQPAISSAVEVSGPEALGRDRYTVAAGAFLLRSNLAGAEKKVKESGFEPLVVQKKKKTEMTRLRVGLFTPEEGKKKMEELEELTPAAFCLPVDGKLAVYAASFQNRDKARSFADRLYKKGLRVEEESAQVDLPCYLLSFGGFADLESAKEAAERVRSKGLEAMVVKNL